MLDFHLAMLYDVETRVLKQQIKRNRERFPEDFMFQLTESEWRELITICDKLGAYKYSPAIPLVFEAIKLLINKEEEPRNPVGFKIS